MKAFFRILGISLMAVGVLSAESVTTKTKCECENCMCTPEKHCGCLSKSEPKSPSDACKCGDNCPCGSNCECK